jgi:hypothetical protein
MRAYSDKRKKGFANDRKKCPVDRMRISSTSSDPKRNLRIIESELDVKVLDRDSELRTAEIRNSMYAENAIEGLQALACQRREYYAQNVR